KSIIALSLSFSLSFSFATLASAQTEAPSPEGRTGVVIGQIANGTADGEVPGELAVMLHAWDENGETVMLDGVADSTGAFRFDEVPMQDGWVFAAMLTYNDVTFFSDPGQVTPNTQELLLPLQIYETASDASPIRISQLHAFFDFSPGEVLVTEVYVLSNPTDRAIMGGLKLAEGATGTLQFALPAEANKVKFESDDGARFVITPYGFADTGAVLPGEGTTQAIVSYTLPYSSGMTFTHPVNYPVEMMSAITSVDSGVALGGNGLSEAARREFESGEVLDIYSAASLPPGESLAVTLTGEPTYRAADGTTGAMADPSLVPNTLANRWGIPVAGGILGLAMIGAGVWLWRRSRMAEEEEAAAQSYPENEWSNILHAIAELDEAHERGEVADAEFQPRRAELHARAKVILRAEEEKDDHDDDAKHD
ncbi:MAG: hypothetical protein AAB342_06845, partial [Chloroflexota bacterium]